MSRLCQLGQSRALQRRGQLAGEPLEKPLLLRQERAARLRLGDENTDGFAAVRQRKVYRLFAAELPRSETGALTPGCCPLGCKHVDVLPARTAGGKRCAVDPTALVAAQKKRRAMQFLRNAPHGDVSHRLQVECQCQIAGGGKQRGERN